MYDFGDNMRLLILSAARSVFSLYMLYDFGDKNFFFLLLHTNMFPFLLRKRFVFQHLTCGLEDAESG